MAADCPDCSSATTRTRPATRSSALPIRLRVNGGMAPLSSFVCTDCGRIRFTTKVNPGEENCSVCDGAAAAARLRTPSEELRLLDADREVVYPLSAIACADCGAVELRASDVGGATATTCPACRGGMRRTTPAVGTDRIDFIEEARDADGPPLRGPVEPLAWACTDCGLVLVYDRGRAEEGGGR